MPTQLVIRFANQPGPAIKVKPENLWRPHSSNLVECHPPLLSIHSSSALKYVISQKCLILSAFASLRAQYVLPPFIKAVLSLSSDTCHVIFLALDQIFPSLDPIQKKQNAIYPTRLL